MGGCGVGLAYGLEGRQGGSQRKPQNWLLYTQEWKD